MANVSANARFGYQGPIGSSHKYRTGGSSNGGPALNFDSVLARAASSSLTAAQVAQRQRGMMSSRIQTFDAAFSGHAQASGTSHPAWLNGIGAQFEAHSSGLSSEQH
ncbi:hypothetical protein DHEL01_v213068 [Diaporthe helianthi]|uniref:Uncharacterized protein n=1 Tax=Diaporthe helianthi TaxID=158607 RepID=A0A2P5HE60_DIAHE|nr:hypothetical protein DHEL01_v213068 [Diaporthe helianthi]